MDFAELYFYLRPVFLIFLGINSFKILFRKWEIILTLYQMFYFINFKLNSKINYVPDDSLFLFASTWFDGFDVNSCLNDPRFDTENFRISSSFSKDFQNAKVVVFHPYDFNFKHLPRERPKGQLWVWLNLEPPKYVKYLGKTNGHFNYTASYKTNSDIFLPYGYFIEKPNFTFHNKYLKPFDQRNHSVCWIVSNWKSTFRNSYYEKLKEFINIDVYTGLPRDKNIYNKCEHLSQCKFYLSFENSNHSDYITEKLWYNAYQCGAIPIVLGTVKSDYLKQNIPSDSIIHVDDFSSPEELANYIRRVENNMTLYESYFNWRKGRDIYFEDSFGTYYCRVVDYIRKYQPKPHKDNLTADWFIENYPWWEPNV